MKKLSYNGAGQLVEMEDWNGKTAIERDPLQRVKSVKDAFGRQVRYAWDEVSNRIEVAYPEGGVVRYGYDGERRNTSMTDAKGLETGFRFDAAGNLVEKAYPNGERTAYAYDPNRRLREMREYGAASGGGGGLSPAVTRYDWDAQGNRTGEAVERDGAITAKVFGYDALNRLIRVEEPQGVQQYAYDGLGNLVRESGPEYARRYEYNALNQLVRREESRTGGAPTALAYEYDLRGNRVRERSAQDGRVMKEFAYDGANRMVGGTTEKGSSFYRYDGLGRRVGREQEKNSVQYVVDFVSGRNDDLAAYTQGFFSQSYSYANGQRIQQVTKAWEDVQGAQSLELPPLPEELYIHEDIMGSTRRWSTASGDTYAQVEYDVWGLPVQLGDNEENILNPRYTNHTYDDVLGMYHAQFRFLDATNRGFTAVDPIKDEQNWYAYVAGNPATFVDPLGLEAYSIRAIGSNHEGEYDLFVSPQWFDVLESVAGSVPFFAPLNWVAQRTIGGRRSIEYDLSPVEGLITDLARSIFKNDVVQSMAKNVGWVLTGIEGLGYINDWFFEKQYQIEESIYNHFARDIWISDTRDLVDRKFSFAINNMAFLTLMGHVEIRKAVDVFGESVFSNRGGATGMATMQYDPLTGKNKVFRQNEYYFFPLSCYMDGKISDHEKRIRLGTW